jgi:hypothetical protein
MASSGNNNALLAMDSEDVYISTKEWARLIELRDGSYNGLAAGAPLPKIENLQRDLAAVDKPALTEAKIVQLQEDGLI